MVLSRISLYVLAFLLAACTVERSDEDPARQAAADSARPSYRVDSVIVPNPRPPRSFGPDSTLSPIDQASSDPDLLAFRRRLLVAVAERDTAALFNAMVDDIRVSFGTANGKDGFRDMWAPAQRQSEVWLRLAQVLGAGGVYVQDETSFDGHTATARFSAPYYTAAFPGDRFDSFQTGVVLGPDVPLRAEPSDSSEAIAALAYAIVGVPSFIPNEQSSGDWIRVRLAGDRFGFVHAEDLGSPIGHRAVLHKIDGAWKMTAFVAGD